MSWWKTLLAQIGLAVLDASAGAAKEKLTPRDPRDIGKSGKTPTSARMTNDDLLRAVRARVPD